MDPLTSHLSDRWILSWKKHPQLEGWRIEGEPNPEAPCVLPDDGYNRRCAVRQERPPTLRPPLVEPFQ